MMNPCLWMEEKKMNEDLKIDNFEDLQVWQEDVSLMLENGQNTEKRYFVLHSPFYG